MIGTMNNRVAVGAGRTHYRLTGKIGINIVTTIDKTRVVRLRMATLTQERLPYRKHALLRRTVRFVAGGAIFTDRLMLPQKRPPLLCMASYTGVINGTSSQHAGSV